MKSVTSHPTVSGSIHRQSILNAIVAVTSVLTIAAETHAATVYDWTGGTSLNWSDAANWTPQGAPTNAAPMTGDTANLNDTGSSRKIIYNSAASGALGALNFTQTSNAVDTLDIQKNLNVASAITLGASNGGTSRMYVDPSVAGTFTLTTTGITLNSGGVLELSTYKTAAGTFVSKVTGPVIINNGGQFIVDQSKSSVGLNDGQSTTIGAVSLSTGGLLSWGSQTPTGNAAAATGTYTNNDRLVVSGNLTINGGTVTVGFAANADAINQPGNALYLVGATNSITGLSAAFTPFVVLNASIDQSFLSDSALPGGLSMRGGSGTTQTFTVGATTPSATLKIDSTLRFQANGAAPAYKMLLASNIDSKTTINANSGGSGVVMFAIDLAGHQLDVSRAAAVEGLPNGDATTVWNITNSGGSSAIGTFKAYGFNLTGPANGATIGSNVNLLAVGTGGFTNNLGNVNGGSTIASDSTFTYAGSASNATPDTLTSNRTIGNLAVAPVTTGTLKLLSNISTTSGSTSVAAGGTLDLNTFALTTTDLNVTGTGIIKGTTGSSVTASGTVSGTGTIGAASGITSNGMLAPATAGTVGTLTIGAGSGALTLASTNTASFDIGVSSFDKVVMASNLTNINYDGVLSLNFASAPTNGQTFALFNGFGSGTGNFSSISSNLSSAYSFSFAPATGVLTVVVPEPASLAVFVIAGLFGLRRRTKLC